MNQKPPLDYERDFSHYHCWESKNPPCGQKVEHLYCCLCEKLNPKCHSPKPESATTEPMEDELEHAYAVEVKLLARFYDLYEQGRKSGAPQNFIDFFEAQHYLLIEVEKALALAEARGAEKYKKSLRIGFVRQWLNEDRITDPKRMVTNEEIEHMLFATSTN